MIEQNNRLNRLTINRPSTGHQDIKSTTIPPSDPSSELSPCNCERSVERVVAMEPQAIRRASRRHGTANDPSSESSPPSCKRTAYMTYTASNDKRDSG